jgi:hypothetical protein
VASSILPLVLSVSMHTVVVCIYSLADKVSHMGDLHIVCHNECHRGLLTYLVIFNISLGYIGDLNIFVCISVCVKAAAKQYWARQMRDKLNAMNES